MRQIFKDTEDFKQEFKDTVSAQTGKEYDFCGKLDLFTSLCKLVASKARDVAGENEAQRAKDGTKKVYYFSLEFLIGRLLDNYLLNFGVRDMVAQGLSELGLDLEELEDQEPDPGLGNGGLGRLAACYMDSLAADGYAGYGMGLRYQYGLFRQDIKDGKQVELADDWLAHGYPWERRRPESAVEVMFGGHVTARQDGDRTIWGVDGGQRVLAVPYDIPVVGFGGETVNRIRVWSAEPIEAKFDLEAFNNGDYAAASRASAECEAITTLLYPSDATESGRILRLKQEYMLVSAGMHQIIREFQLQHGEDWKHLPDYVAIQTNDTHPAMCGPELMRILMDEKFLTWEEAWPIATQVVAYTNHTVLPEALEKWPISTFSQLFPRLYQIIEEISRRYHTDFPKDKPNWQDLLRGTAPLWDGEVRMANLSVICGHAVNGVAEVHSQIIKDTVLKDFYALTPEKFLNVTNGVSPRRFLANANPGYAKLISSVIGDGWLADLSEIKKLEPYADDPSFREEAAKVKHQNKVRYAKYLKEHDGFDVDPDFIFDVHAKRFHAYKRQLLSLFKVIDLYNRLKDDPNLDIVPTAFVFSGKAAQSYVFAKETIRLVNSVAQVVNNDPAVNKKMRVVFMKNYNVSNACIMYAATDISEQISTAGMEASGTSNMKLMMNGAVMLGTRDGANIEIAEEVGEDNVKYFGLNVDEVEALKASGNYFSWDMYNNDARLHRVIDELSDQTFAELSGNFESIRSEVMLQNDKDLVLRDFGSYVQAWDELNAQYRDDQDAWMRRSVLNTARSGKFTSDRAIHDYARDIWHL